jgi:hypothetical protein
MQTVEERLAALEQSKQALEERVVDLEHARARSERRLRWWRGTAGLLLLAGVAIGPPQKGEAQGTMLDQRVAVLEGKLARVNVVNNGRDIVIDGANVYIVNGQGDTQTANGFGNLILGYNEAQPAGQNFRTGSHNLILGQQNNFTSFGGIVGGVQNLISGPFAHVLTGYQNGASQFYSFVATGNLNNAAAAHAAVTGGQLNTATGLYSSVTGGQTNTASNEYSSVNGGSINRATGRFSVVTGGDQNSSDGLNTVVSGGRFRMIGTDYTWRAGDLIQLN